MTKNLGGGRIWNFYPVFPSSHHLQYSHAMLFNMLCEQEHECYRCHFHRHCKIDKMNYDDTDNSDDNDCDNNDDNGDVGDDIDDDGVVGDDHNLHRSE